MASGFASGAATDFASVVNTRNARDLVGQLSVSDQAKYYSGQMSASEVKSKVLGQQLGDLALSEVSKFGANLFETSLFGKGSPGTTGYQPGLFGGLINSILGVGSSSATPTRSRAEAEAF